MSTQSLTEVLADSVARHGDRVAVRLGEMVLTYSELSEQVDHAAVTLRRNGLEPGDRVALMLGNRPSYVVAFYAALRAGGVVVPINTSLTSPEIAHELSDSDARAMVVGRAYTPTLAKLQGTLPALEEVYVADTTQPVDADSGMRSWAQARQATVTDGDVASLPIPNSQDLAVLAYTSGTTASPRGAMLRHDNLLANQRQLAASGAAIHPDDIVFTALPLFHSYALTCAMGMAMSGGGALELVERFEPATSLALVVERAVTVVVGAPPMYVAWSNLPTLGVDLSRVRLATSGAAPLPTRVLQRCADDLGLDVREGYGLAEASPVVTSSVSLPAAVPGCVGRPLEGVEVRITDDGSTAEPGDPGRVQVRGDNVFAGYWRDEEATKAVTTDDGWLDTGDIGYLDNGLLYLVDRAKDVVIVSGFNVFPSEVEQVLASHPDVLQAAVVGVPHPYTGEALKAYVVTAAGAELTADELSMHAADRLARFKRPDAIEFVDSLPTALTGKVRRRLLRSDDG